MDIQTIQHLSFVIMNQQNIGYRSWQLNLLLKHFSDQEFKEFLHLCIVFQRIGICKK